MSTSATTESAPTVKAKRGDLAVVVSRTSNTFIGQESREDVRITLGRVSSVTREGLVKRYEEASFADGEAREQKVRPRDQVLIVGAASVDVEAILSEYRKHTWQATGGSDSDMIRPYASMDEVRQLIRLWRYPHS